MSIPREPRSQTSLRVSLVAWLVRLAGIGAILETLSQRVPHKIAHTIYYVDANPILASRVLDIALGLALLYLAQQLARRKFSAYYLTVTILVILIGAEFVRFKHMGQLFLYASVLAILLLTRHLYDVKNDSVSFRRIALVSTMLLGVTFVYGTIGFLLLRKAEFHHIFSVDEAMEYTLRQMATLGDYTLVTHSKHARLFLQTLNAATDTSLVLVFTALFRPIRFRVGALPYERHVAEEILDKWSDSTEDYFKLWPRDKHYFFNAYRDAFVAYKLVGSTAIVLDGPSGNPDHIEELVKEFSEYCAVNSWRLTVVHSDSRLRTLYESMDLKELAIGQEAVVSIPEFAAKTQGNKHFRYVKNRAERENLHFSLWQAPLTDEQIGQLREVSASWLRHNNRHEYTFAMGYFDEEYLRSCVVATLQDADGRVIAYTNVVPSFVGKARTIDHMRSVPEVSQVAMHFLLMRLILSLNDQQIEMFNLGFVPLADVSEEKKHSASERALSIIKRFGGGVYSFGGLEQFKGKFEPDWQPRYLYYPPQSLVQVASALNTAVSIDPTSNKLRRLKKAKTLVWPLALTGAIANASWPLAYFYNRHMLFRGLVSDLGQQGQHHAFLFNTLDVVGGSAVLILAIWLYIRAKPSLNQFAHFGTLAFALGGLGGIIAALTPLSARLESTTVQYLIHHISTKVLIHGGASTLNSGGFLVAMILWVLWKKREVEHKPVYTLFVLATVLVGVFGFFLGIYFPLVGFSAQRVFIILQSTWMVWFPLALLEQGTRHRTKIAANQVST
ncbi:MAG TPA: phosphatidylglycerol lysyltransferase domain-containing protein [Candidatus Saccharimonadales bacterium]|nr:phosphatidylglycerol lysyltransferase domain-containing protein [Candidatus Saccharimonadales bacterium]